MKSQISLLLLSVSLLTNSLSLLSAKEQKQFLHSHLHTETERYSADQVLNGEFPGRKASPPVSAVHNTDGFAAERLYSVPEPGVHPRVLFSSADLPRIRQQMAESKAATKISKQMRSSNQKLLIDNEWGRDSYEALIQGDLQRFLELWQDSKNPKPKLCYPGHGKHPLFSAMLDEAFFALIDEDTARGKRAASAITNYSKYLLPRVQEAAKKPGAENHWLQVRGVIGDSAIFGLMYDFAQPFMDEEQTKTVRNTLAAVIKDRYGLGMDLPDHWVNWNFIGMGLYYPLIALAIEGEAGYDPRIYKRGVEVARNYILYGNTENGVGTEGVGYHTAGMAHMAMAALAMANRGDVLFTLTNWRNMFEKWLIHANQPYGKEWVSSGDLGTFPPSQVLVGIASYFYPKNDKIAYIKNQVPLDKMNSNFEKRYMPLLCPPDLNADESDIASIKKADFNMEPTLFDEKRGLLFTRTGWGEEDLMLQVACRQDTAFHSHDHPDRGAFYLTALGQSWSASSIRMTEPKYLNTITIDGRGQGYFPTPGKWIEMKDNPEETTAVLDLDYCYDWHWMPTCYFMSDEQMEREPWLEGFIQGRDKLLKKKHLKWERDDSEVAKKYYEGYMAGNPRMWGVEASWVLRAPHFPVKKAFRTISLMRGNNPYVLIVDDIQKDETERLYEWRMKVPTNVEVYNISKGDIILGGVTEKRSKSYSVHHSPYRTGLPVAEKGQAMLLVRVLQANQPDIAAYQDNPKLETLEFIKHDDSHQFAGRSMGVGKRLVIPSRSVKPDYKVFIYPFRHGDPLPETKLSEDGSEVVVTWANQVDKISFKENANGRTVIDRQQQQ